jgi:hypothetical protein
MSGRWVIRSRGAPALLALALGGLAACGGTSRNGSKSDTGGDGGSGAAPATGSSGSGGAGFAADDAKALFMQAPHCSNTSFSLRIEGSIDGVAVSDIRVENSNAGFVNGGPGDFDTPFTPEFPLESGQVAVSLQWTASLAYGQASATSSGIVVPPDGHPLAGQELCVSEGAVGFPGEGAEEGVFKFYVREARVGADCTGEAVPIDVRGCMN